MPDDFVMEVVRRLRLSNGLDDETAFDSMLEDFTKQAADDLAVAGVEFEDAGNVPAYQNALMAYANAFFNINNPKLYDALMANYSQLVLDLQKEVTR